MDDVGVFAPTAWSPGTVVAALGQAEAPLCWKVTQQARHKDGQDAHGRPAHAAVGLAAGAGLVRADVLVVARAVVEKALDAADARAVVQDVLRRADAAPGTEPARGQGPRARALLALALPALLAAVCVLSRLLLHGGLQLLHRDFGELGLRPDNPLRVGALQEPVLGRRAAGAHPRATPGAGARCTHRPGESGGRSVHVLVVLVAVPSRNGPLLLLLDQQVLSRLHFLLGGRQSADLFTPRSVRHHRSFCVLIGTPDYPNLIQREHLDLLAQGLPGIGIPNMLPPAVMESVQQARRPIAILSSCLHV